MAPPPTLPRRYQLHLHSDRLVFGWYDVTVSLYSLTAQRSRNKPKASWKCLQGLWSYRARQCHRCWLYLEILRQKFLLHEYSNLRVLHNLNLYDKLNDMLILIVSYIWSIGGQTKRLLKEIDSRLPCIFSVTDHRWRQNVLITLVGQTGLRLLCHFVYLPRFDVNCDLLLNRQTHSSMESLYRNDVFSENIFRFKKM